MAAVIYRDDEIILAIDNVPYIISYDDPEWEAINAALEEGYDDDELLAIISSAGKMADLQRELEASGLSIDPFTDQLTYEGNVIPADLSKYITNSLERGSAAPIIAFVKRLFQNPNHHTRQSLFQFISANGMPIYDDGQFMAYKVVRSNYLDKHSGTMDLTPGRAPIVIPWSQVDTDPNVTCSRGLHACSRAYIPEFYSEGDRVVTVKVAPEDVGAVPYDYDGSKLRCKQYQVVRDITDQYTKEQENLAVRAGSDAVDGYEGENQAWGHRSHGPVFF
jgi:hypothetical protein